LRVATEFDILDILRTKECERRLALYPILLSLPIDGEGPRIRVSVPRDQMDRVPDSLTFELEGEELHVRCEAYELPMRPSNQQPEQTENPSNAC